ncbi:hypothetical protein GCM10010245_89530 [Streptomyces spectabilis]|uniref:Uncharacterized protein n=1 Tax=Streptomyces spectabilis TaxID=68270 RepID=A0A7W8F0N2_STRST|nr:hypothetical protein [Streptomyces spectabilis]GGV56549.1 hypothetical protein GCM10010245_89530 [Streptomyces spectabilis]
MIGQTSVLPPGDVRARLLRPPYGELSAVQGQATVPGQLISLSPRCLGQGRHPCLQTLVEQEGQHSPALMHGGSGDERMLPQAVFNESAVHLLQPHIPRNRVC